MRMSLLVQSTQESGGLETVTSNPKYIEWWYNLTIDAAIAFAVIGLLVLLIYFVRLMFTKGNKARYDFISKNEIRHFLTAAVFIIIGAAFYFNREIYVNSDLITLFAHIFTTICIGVVIVLIFQAYLKYYYPFFIEKRLKNLRFKPRISPKTGKPMKLLSEEEEDAYLDEGMQAEENVFSVDYDVWKDEETGYIQIEKYSGHLHALRCSECNYQTLKLVQEEIITEPTVSYEGELMKHYKCTYCNHKAKKSVVLKKQHSPNVVA